MPRLQRRTINLEVVKLQLARHYYLWPGQNHRMSSATMKPCQYVKYDSSLVQTAENRADWAQCSDVNCSRIGALEAFRVIIQSLTLKQAPHVAGQTHDLEQPAEQLGWARDSGFTRKVSADAV